MAGATSSELADLRKAPLAVDAVRRIDALFALERTINGLAAGDRLAVRQRESKPIVVDLEKWMRAERARLSRHAETARAIDYMLTRWPAFTRFLDDGRICLSNNAAERALRAIALGRRAWLFVGSDRGGERAAAIYTLIATAKLNDINPLAWLADVLARIADHPASAHALRAPALALEGQRPRIKPPPLLDHRSRRGARRTVTILRDSDEVFLTNVLRHAIDAALQDRKEVLGGIGRGVSAHIHRQSGLPCDGW